MSESVEQEFLSLRNRAWTTSSARYNAARRLKLRSRLSLGVISLISACGVAIPLLASSPAFAERAPSLGLFSALLSLFVLVVAVLESAASFDTKAENLYRNAELLNGFRMRVGVQMTDLGLMSTVELTRLTIEYERIRDSCATNHEYVDYKLHMLRHPGDYDIRPSWVAIRLGELWHFLYSTWWLLALFIATLVLLGGFLL